MTIAKVIPSMSYSGDSPRVMLKTVGHIFDRKLAFVGPSTGSLCNPCVMTFMLQYDICKFKTCANLSLILVNIASRLILKRIKLNLKSNYSYIINDKSENHL